MHVMSISKTSESAHGTTVDLHSEFREKPPPGGGGGGGGPEPRNRGGGGGAPGTPGNSGGGGGAPGTSPNSGGGGGALGGPGGGDVLALGSSRVGEVMGVAL